MEGKCNKKNKPEKNGLFKNRKIFILKKKHY